MKRNNFAQYVTDQEKAVLHENHNKSSAANKLDGLRRKYATLAAELGEHTAMLKVNHEDILIL